MREARHLPPCNGGRGPPNGGEGGEPTHRAWGSPPPPPCGWSPSPARGGGAVSLLLTLFLATAAYAQELRPLCPDRPSKGTSACTVDAGHVQLEADVANLTHDSAGGIATDTWVVANPTLKFGLTDSFDLEANLAPYAHVRVHRVRSRREARELLAHVI